jgi:LysM repeat protein
MRREWSTIVIVLLVVAVVLGGVTGCQRSASTRPTSTPEAVAGDTSPAAPPSDEPTTVTVLTSVAGETPSEEPSGGTPVDVPATEEPEGETPGDVQPTEPAEGDTQPQPTATEAPPPDSGTTVVHIVKRGETLSSIAQQYGTTWQAIQRANNLVNPSQIVVGQKLTIPTGGSSGGSSRCRYRHTVQRGEWLWQIARNYGVDPYRLMEVNGLTMQTADPLFPGKVLCIP